MKVSQFIVTAYDVEGYADVSQDQNPLHLNEKYAKEAGYKGRIAHGMLTMAKIIHIVEKDYLQPTQFIKNDSFTFLAPVYVGDTVVVQIHSKEQQYRIIGTCGENLVVKGEIYV